MSNAIQYEDLAEKVYRSLKAMIMEGELSAGEKLGQEELAAKLGVSRTPLAAAFSKLEKEMLIEVLPRRGARVRSMSSRELLELYEIRIRLEGLGAREAASRFLPGTALRIVSPATPADGAKLERALSEYRKIVAAGQPAAIKKMDFEFHLAVMELSGNKALYSMVASSNIVFISNQRGILKPPAQSLAEHERLVAAILAGNAPEAERIMESHLGESRDSLAARVAANLDKDE